MWNFISGRGGAANFVEALEQRSMLSASTFYVQTNLVSDNALPGTRTDANLVNGWGIAHGATGPWWVSAAERGCTTRYRGPGGPAAPNMAIPPAPGDTEANPAGVAANDSKAFSISSGGKSAPSLYVFVTKNGTISGWNPNVDPNAILTVNNSRAGAVYKGGAIGVSHDAQFFFAADFHNARVDVFNRKFRPVALKRGAFTDTNLPAGYAPFNITNIGGQLYVTYALQDAAAHDDAAGPRHGFIDIYQTDGTLVKRLASRGSLDSPWGTVQAPHNFGKFSDDILVGNFGDGKISAFNHKGKFMGFLPGADGNPLAIDGLWGLGFGNGATAGPTNTLFFAAGPQGESHGLFGALTAGKSHHHAGSSSGGGFNY